MGSPGSRKATSLAHSRASEILTAPVSPMAKVRTFAEGYSELSLVEQAPSGGESRF